MKSINIGAGRLSWGNGHNPTVSFITLIFLLLMLGACASPMPIKTIKKAEHENTIDRNTKVFILHPLLRFERIQDEMPLDGSQYHAKALEAKLKSIYESTLKSRSIGIVAPGSRKAIITSGLSKELRKKMPKLSRGMMDSATRDLLHSFAQYDENINLFVNYIDVKVGSTGSWDPNSGAITSDNSRSLLRSALVNCTTGKVLWKGEVLLREVPELSSERFAESLDLLFTDFPRIEG